MARSPAGTMRESAICTILRSLPHCSLQQSTAKKKTRCRRRHSLRFRPYSQQTFVQSGFPSLMYFFYQYTRLTIAIVRHFERKRGYSEVNRHLWVLYWITGCARKTNNFFSRPQKWKSEIRPPFWHHLPSTLKLISRNRLAQLRI